MTVEDRLAADPCYRALVRDRQRFGWSLTIATALVYAGFIALIAFDKAQLARSITPGSVTTLAVVAGAFMLIGPILICAIYVARANREFDARLGALLTDTAA